MATKRARIIPRFTKEQRDELAQKVIKQMDKNAEAYRAIHKFPSFADTMRLSSTPHDYGGWLYRKWTESVKETEMKQLFRIYVVDPETGNIWDDCYIARSPESAQIKMFTDPDYKDSLAKDIDDYDIKVERIMEIRDVSK